MAKARKKTRTKKTAKKAAKRSKTTKKAGGGEASKKKVARTARKKVTSRTKTKTKASSRSAGTRTKSARKKTKTTGRAAKPARKRFKSATLVEQSRQIHCEAQMLRSVVSALTGNSSSSASVEDRARRNAFNESFCLHLRPLIDFFWEGRAGNKEAVARDFFAKPRQWRPSKPQDYRDLKKRLAKEINALTTTRYGDLEIKEWPYRRIFDELFVEIDRFQSTAPEENVDECWRDRPVAALSAAGTQATVTGSGQDTCARPKVESTAPTRAKSEPALIGTKAAETFASALTTGSAFGGVEALPTSWSSTNDDDEDQDESRLESSREPVFASDFGPPEDDED